MLLLGAAEAVDLVDVDDLGLGHEDAHAPAQVLPVHLMVDG